MKKQQPLTADRILGLEVKEISASGTFEGWLAVYDDLDLSGEIIDKGAFAKTLQQGGSSRPVLWQHNIDEPIGTLEVEEREKGLFVKGKLLMELPTAQKAHALIKNRIVRGLSVGFRTIQDAVDKGVRHIKEARLFEGSIVTFPANEGALITSVKSQSDDLTILDALQNLSWAVGPEEKAGRRLSAATRERMKQVMDLLSALLEEEAADDGTSSKAAAQLETPEPVPDHSAISAQIEEMRALLQ